MTMANKDDNRSTNDAVRSTRRVKIKLDHVKTEDPEPDPIDNSSKRRKTDSVDDPHGNEGMWRGNVVGPEAKELLQAVEKQYPNTFQGVQIRAKPIWLNILKELHLGIKSFMETSVDELVEEKITGFQEDFEEFEKFGFDLSWARKRLDMVDRLKFGKEPLQNELNALEESLEPLKERVKRHLKQIMEAHDMWKKAQLEYDNVKDARDKKAQEVELKFGAEYDRVLKGHLGFGMLPGY
ncbi:hypothetical protein Lser_V15G01658 [Lactuca serriola]